MSYDKSDKLHIVAVTAAIRREDGRYLILKRSEHEKAFPGYWCFPGGKVEGEQTLDEALAEEIKEETGLTMKGGKVLLRDVAFTRPDEQTVKVFVYLCGVENPDNVTLEEDGFTEYAWVTPEELESYQTTNLQEEVVIAEKIIASAVDLDLMKNTSYKNK